MRLYKKINNYTLNQFSSKKLKYMYDKIVDINQKHEFENKY